MDFKGSKTEKNLYRTFAGEARANTKYTIFAEQAREEGYRWVGEIFDVTAHNELAHAREAFSKYLKLNNSTKDNLMDCILGETEEYTNIYKKFEKEAREEGFIEIADFFKEVIEVEESHAERYKKLYDKIEDGTMFKGPKESKWVCMNCGYIHEGEEAPLICPLCKYPRAYFKPYCDITNN